MFKEWLSGEMSNSQSKKTLKFLQKAIFRKLWNNQIPGIIWERNLQYISERIYEVCLELFLKKSLVEDPTDNQENCWNKYKKDL